MTANLEALQSLLLEICELGAVAEDKGVTKIPSFDPIIEKARGLGIDISAPTTLDDLRAAVENACELVKTGANPAAPAANRIAATKIFGNSTGIPGDGP